jgi:hypothetical protein
MNRRRVLVFKTNELFKLMIYSRDGNTGYGHSSR